MLNNPTGRTADGSDRETALAWFYDAERRSGATIEDAHERTAEFAKRLDVLAKARAS
jgi:hypothetical protein